jgi:hypothetical protein
MNLANCCFNNDTIGRALLPASGPWRRDVTRTFQFFVYSVGFTAPALTLFGEKNGQFSGLNKAKSGGQTLLVGGLAAANACAWRIFLMDEL